MTQTAARRPALAVDPLDDRLAPAVTANILDAGLLSVSGDGADSRVAVTREGDSVVVRSEGRTVGTFPAASVTQLLVTTGAGNDRIEIAEDVTAPAIIDAGEGRNVVKTGGGATTVLGGAGVDKFRSGVGGGTVDGGAGDDRLVGGEGATDFDGGAGADRILNVGTLDTVAPDPADLVGRVGADPAATVAQMMAALGDSQGTVTAAEVKLLLDRASAATASNDAIIAVTDRNGRILGVRVEDGVAPEIRNDSAKLVFAVDGALAKARTSSFFGTDQVPLTSRIIQFLSQTTITEREVKSNPNITDPNSRERGPGFVASVGVGGHFPPQIARTPPADIFGIEHTNRDASFSPGADRIRGTADDIRLRARLNADPAFIPDEFEASFVPPDSYGFVSGLLPGAQSRGLGTLPGGIPIIKGGKAVGAIGVFFPGKTGFASEENDARSTLYDPTKPDRSLEAEYIAFVALGGSSGAGFSFAGPLGNAPALPAGFDLPFARVDLVGITLDLYGPGGIKGPENLVRYGTYLGVGQVNGTELPVGTADEGAPLYKDGLIVPVGWVVLPHDGVGITKEEVEDVVTRGLIQTLRTRSAVRGDTPGGLPEGNPARLIFAVTDKTGDVVGLFRMPDATNDALDVTVEKARNVAYISDPAQVQDVDVPPGLPKGVAYNSRTFRYLAQPRFPEGIDGAPPGPWSILNDGGSDPFTGKTIGEPLPASAFQSPFGYDAFHPGTNFRQQQFLANQNGVSFFPAGVALYRNGEIIGGYGTSGDGVDQNDLAAFAGSVNFGVPNELLRADEVKVNGVRLPYTKFGRNPEATLPT